MHQMRLSAGIRPDPLKSLIGGHGRNERVEERQGMVLAYHAYEKLAKTLIASEAGKGPQTFTEQGSIKQVKSDPEGNSEVLGRPSNMLHPNTRTA